MNEPRPQHEFLNAMARAAAAGQEELTPEAAANLHAILSSPSYVPAELDTLLLSSQQLRPVRIQLELLKIELALQAAEVHATVVVFGSTQILHADAASRRLDRLRGALHRAPGDSSLQRAVAKAERLAAKSSYYEEAREFARLVALESRSACNQRFVVMTGGGPGIMEAANRGAFDTGARSIGLNITLPTEQCPNPYITPELCFQFHYFALRKMHFLLRAKALVVFPGGFGTIDELFDALTLRQTRRMPSIPVIMVGRSYWEQAINFHFLADEGVIEDEDLDSITLVDSAREAWDVIVRCYQSSADNRTG